MVLFGFGAFNLLDVFWRFEALHSRYKAALLQAPDITLTSYRLDIIAVLWYQAFSSL